MIAVGIETVACTSSALTMLGKMWRTITRGLSADFVHRFVGHATEYVNGHVHTNGLENFWSLLKRALHGAYISVEPFHLHRYVDEQAFRYNERFGKDGDRFLTVLRGIVGRSTPNLQGAHRQRDRRRGYDVSDRGEAPRENREMPEERKLETERGPTPWERFVSLARKVTQTRRPR
ncbi:MAG TPA: transposase [Candidatus Acidoferrum sp.]|nr:transposase [Candidatus Acidoferrum sp.]